ncbi:hypothetical protein [Xenorhabdus taiwanensis]|uniref:Uncharacterized protein n=1 Tax=Xenorhabdus taiwanensis TaxID=3085177 RepID=A0ABN7C523_9GAMM|nr:hypothetical protein TCT1_23490 [Xenorhabdus sp. TCT-1]
MQNYKKFTNKTEYKVEIKAKIRDIDDKLFKLVIEPFSDNFFTYNQEFLYLEFIQFIINPFEFKILLELIPGDAKSDLNDFFMLYKEFKIEFLKRPCTTGSPVECLYQIKLIPVD